MHDDTFDGAYDKAFQVAYAEYRESLLTDGTLLDGSTPRVLLCHWIEIRHEITLNNHWVFRMREAMV